MTRIDFYVLPESAHDARQRFACRLAHRAWQAGHRVYVHAADADDVTALDTMMWSFPTGRFLPHARWQPEAHPERDADAPVHIGHDADPADHDDVLINLAAGVPPFFERFGRVAEVVVQSPDIRTAGRTRFRFYRERGYPLHHHDMQHWTDD